MKCFDHVTTPCGDMILIGSTPTKLKRFFSREDAECGEDARGKVQKAFMEKGQVDWERFPFLMARLW
jgi:hypothetical protein